jgi:glycosyltransferase 2 family protein
VRRLNLILLAVAGVFLVWLLQEIGWSVLMSHLSRVGWLWPLLLAPYGLVILLEALAWECLLSTKSPQPRLPRLFWLYWGGEALNTLTPTASLGGEPHKAVRLQATGLSFEEATASVVIQKALKVISLVLYICMGLLLAPFFLPELSSHLTALIIGAASLGLAVAAFVAVQRQDPCARAIRLLDRFNLCPRFLKEKEGDLCRLDARLASFYREHPGRSAAALVLLFLAWACHSVEIYLIFWLLGHPIGWGTALCLDPLTMIFSSLGFFIPASLGFQEGGNILLALGFHLGAALGAAFSLMRRAREAVWMGLGLVVAAWK